eukprot:SAG11_NODE_13178_length_666_cov_1.749559_2_plen_30_part_01
MQWMFFFAVFIQGCFQIPTYTVTLQNVETG